MRYRWLFVAILAAAPALAFADDNTIVWHPAGPVQNQSAGNQTRGMVWDLDAVGGFRRLNYNDWAPVDHQAAYGFSGDLGYAGWGLPLRAEMSIENSYRKKDDGGTQTADAITKATFTDLTLGARYMPLTGLIRPYIGAGFAHSWISADGSIAGQSGSASGSSNGFYTHAGFMLVTHHFNFGIEYGGIFGGNVTLEDVKLGAGQEQFSAMLGYSWY